MKARIKSYWLCSKRRQVWMVGVQADDNREANGTPRRMDDTAGNLS